MSREVSERVEAILDRYFEGMELASCPEQRQLETTAISRNLRGLGSEAALFLKEKMKNGNPLDRLRASTGLYYLFGQAAPAVRELAAGLSDEQDRVRINCANSLGFIQEEATPAIPELVNAMGDRVWLVREAVADALANLRPVEKILAALKSENWATRANAAGVLLRMARKCDLSRLSSRIADALVERLSDENEHVRENAALALIQLKRGVLEKVYAAFKVGKVGHKEADLIFKNLGASMGKGCAATPKDSRLVKAILHRNALRVKR